MNILTQLAAAESGSNIFTALGIDLRMLIFQIVAFLVLVWVMGKYVYPILIKTIDARQNQIEEGVKAAADAEKKAEDMKAEVANLLKQARSEASDVVATAKEEAAALVEKAEARAKERADKTIQAAHEQIEKDIIAAKKALHNETLDLVALATEKVIGKTVSAKVDEGVISAAVKEAK